MYMNLLGKPTDADLNTFPHVLLTGPMNGTPLSWIKPTLPQLVTPPGPQIPPNAVYMTPGLMNLAILRGEYTTPSLIPLATPEFLNKSMLSKLNPLILRNSDPTLAESANTPLKQP